MALTTEPSRDPCTKCGACCAAFRVDFHVSELEDVHGRGVPKDMVVPVTRTLVRMRNTDAAPPRCIALRGDVGRFAYCGIYANRPSPCQDFAPYAPLGMGDEACARARARHGLKPLGDERPA